MSELNNIEQLKVKRTELEGELKKVVTDIVTHQLKEDLESTFKEAGVEVTSISWDFYPESDDEGGSIYYPEGVSVNTVGDVGVDEIIIKEKSSYNDKVWETPLEDYVRETLSEYSSDLYDYDIYEITL